MKFKLRERVVVLCCMILGCTALLGGAFIQENQKASALSLESNRSVYLQTCCQESNGDDGSSNDVVQEYDRACYIEAVALQSTEETVQPFNFNISVLDGDTCNSISSSHGEGRENGYHDGFLSSGCGNYRGFSYSYGTTNIPYYFDMSTMTEAFANNVRNQIAMWNSVEMHDGTGQFVNFYEVNSTNKINGREVIIVSRAELTNASGLFTAAWNKLTIQFNIDGMIVDTPLHEFGHALGLDDLDEDDNSAKHKNLMGYASNTTASTLNQAIKYQDIQGAAVLNQKHTNHQFTRYIKQDEAYIHLCFYCDAMQVLASAGEGSSPMELAANCEHTFQQMVSAGERHWLKCTKCYKVVESSFFLRGIQEDGEIGLEVLGLINPSQQVLNIPASYGGQSVVRIGTEAFINQTQITSVTIPETLVSIGEGAFSGCTNLEVIYFENDGSLVEIGARAFENCVDLNEMTLPDTLECLGAKAFLNCSSLGIIYVPRDMESIAGDSFDGCDGVEAIVYNAVSCGDFSSASQPFTALINAGATITLTTNVQRIPAYFMKDCVDLATISIPNSVTLIGTSAFEGCTKLSMVTIPESVTMISNRAFYGCSGMSSITVNATSLHVGTEAFAYSGLYSIAFPNVVVTIGDRAFYNCTRLQGVTIHIMMSGLGEQTFYGCSILIYVSVFYTTAEFDPNVFYGASPTNVIWKFENSGYYRSENNHLIRRSDNALVLGNYIYGIPTSVTSIADEAFIGRFRLTTLTIPVNVTSIGSRVFKDCSGLTALNYSGTMAEWAQIQKAADWNEGSSITSVVCSDGSISV